MPPFGLISRTEQFTRRVHAHVQSPVSTGAHRQEHPAAYLLEAFSQLRVGYFVERKSQGIIPLHVRMPELLAGGKISSVGG